MHKSTIYLQTTSRADCFADILAAGLLSIHPDTLAAAPIPGVMIQYIGRMVQAPAGVDLSTNPPTITTEAVYYAGERCNVYCFAETQEEADALAAKLTAATLANGTSILAAPASPKFTTA